MKLGTIKALNFLVGGLIALLFVVLYFNYQEMGLV